MAVGKFAREAAAALLRWSQTSSDRNVAAAMVEKAADIWDRFDALTTANPDTSPLAPDVEPDGRNRLK
jgi:hypothetical protein